jgi:DNA replication protein DnaD
MDTAQKARPTTEDKLKFIEIIPRLELDIADISDAIDNLTTDQLIAGEANELLAIKKEYQINLKNALAFKVALEREQAQAKLDAKMERQADLKKQAEEARNQVTALLAQRDVLLVSAKAIEDEIDSLIRQQQTTIPISPYASLGSRLGKVFNYSWDSDGRLTTSGTVGGY